MRGAGTPGALHAARAGLERALRRRFTAVEAQALAVKAANVLLAARHMRARDTVLLSQPFGLVVDPSNVCRLACPGCVHSTGVEARQVFDWPRATLAEPLFAALLERYGPAAVGVYFCNYGEPLLNRNTPRLIRMAKEYLAATALSTSLSVERFDAEALVASGLDVMIASIDGATQPVYQRFRHNGRLELVRDNLARLVEAKRRMGRRTPLVSWNFLAFEHNAHEIPAAERMARRLGADWFRVVTPFDVSWDDPEIRPAAVEPYVRRLRWSSLSGPAENWNAFPESVQAGAIAAAFERPFGNEGEPGAGPGHTCHWLYRNMVMDATGRVLPCCGAPPADGKLAMGRFEGEGDPFHSPRYRAARSFFAGRPVEAGEPLQCRECAWDQTSVNIGGPEVRRYFRAADPWFFDRRSLDVLAES